MSAMRSMTIQHTLYQCSSPLFLLFQLVEAEIIPTPEITIGDLSRYKSCMKLPYRLVGGKKVGYCFSVCTNVERACPAINEMLDMIAIARKHTLQTWGQWVGLCKYAHLFEARQCVLGTGSGCAEMSLNVWCLSCLQ